MNEPRGYAYQPSNQPRPKPPAALFGRDKERDKERDKAKRLASEWLASTPGSKERDHVMKELVSWLLSKADTK